MKLYEITNDVIEIENMMEELEKEATTPEELAELEAKKAEILASMQDALMNKGAGVIKRIQDYKSMANNAKEEAKRLTELAKYYEKQAGKIEDYAVMCLEGAGIPKVETELGRMSLRKGAKSLEILDEDLIPDSYKEVKTETVTTVKVDKVQLKKDIKDLDNDSLAFMGVKLNTGKTKLVIK